MWRLIAILGCTLTAGVAAGQDSLREWVAAAGPGEAGSTDASAELHDAGIGDPPSVSADDFAEAMADVDETHRALFEQDRFPSATSCADCHPKHYAQWSISQHAYAQMSPVFNAMAGEILLQTNGTNGDFCIRCHTPVGMNLGEPEFASNIDRHPTSREGVTCIACHRVNQSYGKLSGRLAIEEGPLTQPVYGPKGDNAELNRVVDQAGLATEFNPDNPTRKVHGQTEKFFQLTTPGHCGTCHDVTLINGFRLEEAFSEFKNSPANAAGVSCQDCHMGLHPGKTMADKSDPDFDRKNYDFGPAAKVGSVETAPRKLTNHMFVGPDYSVLHPALFPLHPDIKEEHEKGDTTADGWTIRQWLTFDWKAGWGDEVWEYETDGPLEAEFPTWAGDYTTGWDNPDDREAGRRVILRNLGLLRQAHLQRLNLLRTGYVLGDVMPTRLEDDRLEFKVQVRNGTDGHNVPTGFDAERLVWLDVRVYDHDGNQIMASGDLDPNGDLRDLHSAYVHNRELPQDDQLFSLQSKFLVRMLRGGEREQVLAINYSPTVLPFVRPATNSTILTGRPAGSRKHKKGIEPLGERWASYRVDQDQLTGGPYRIVAQLKAAMVPVNLVNEIKDVGFDYGMSARDVAENLVHGHVDAEGNVVIWRDTLDPPADPQRYLAVGSVLEYQGRIVEIGWLRDGAGTVQQEMDIARIQRELADDDTTAERKQQLRRSQGAAVAEIWHLDENLGIVPVADLKQGEASAVTEYRQHPDANRVVGHQTLWEKQIVVAP